MNLEIITEYCNSLPRVTTDIKWEDHLCFNVGEKMFLITSPDNVPVSASFKTNPDDFELLTEREGIIPAPYLARYKWVQVDDINRLSEKEWQEYVPKSYQLVASKLPKKIQKELNLL